MTLWFPAGKTRCRLEYLCGPDQSSQSINFHRHVQESPPYLRGIHNIFLMYLQSVYFHNTGSYCVQLEPKIYIYSQAQTCLEDPGVISTCPRTMLYHHHLRHILKSIFQVLHPDNVFFGTQPAGLSLCYMRLLLTE